MIKLISLTFGYAESESAYRMVYVAENPAKNKKAAFHSFTEYLYQKYLMDYEIGGKPAVRKCCVPFLDKEPFCPKCGHSLEKDEFDWEQWKDYLFELSTSTIDDHHEHEEVPNPNRWDPYSTDIACNSKQYIAVPCRAIEMLSIALGEIHPELKCAGDFFYNNDHMIETYMEDYQVLFMD